MNNHHHEEIDSDHHNHSHELPPKIDRQQQILSFIKPHSHDNADSIDTALISSQVGIRAVKNSLLILGLTALFQLLVVTFTGSIALLADSIHNFADASTSIPLWIAFSLGKKQPTQKYSYGFGRAEDIAGLFVIGIIAVSAVIAFWEALGRLIHPQPVFNLFWVATAAIVGFLGNEIVAQYRIKTGHRIGSAALVADGYHARSDGFSSLAVLLGAFGVWVGLPAADPIIGMGITVVIGFVLKSASVQIFHRLMDAIDPKLILNAIQVVSSIKGVSQVNSLRIRWSGHSLQADTEITVDKELTQDDIHLLTKEIRHQLHHELPKLEKVLVHIDSIEQA